MKGLLKKDWYMAKRYCRSYILIVLVYGVLGSLPSGSFLRALPGVMAAMIPVTILAYDERSHWEEYSMTLPVTAKQMVGSKYLLGIGFQLAALLISTVSYVIYAKTNNCFSGPDFIGNMGSILILSALAGSLCLPVMFRWGVEKGRIAYYAVIVLAMVISSVITALQENGVFTEVIPHGWAPLLLLAAAAALELGSWRLSARFYAKRRNEI